MTAHSMACDEDSPAPSGTSESRSRSKPGTAMPRCCSAQITPRGYLAQPLAAPGARAARSAVDDALVAVGGQQPDGGVAARPDGRRRPLVDGEGQDEALVVVGVLADQVYPAGAGQTPCRGRAEGGLEAGPPGRRSRRRCVLCVFMRGRLPGSGWCGLRAAGWTATSRSRAATDSGVVSLMKAPMAASEPARYLSLSAARRGDVSCRCRWPARRRAGSSGAWCQAAM